MATENRLIDANELKRHMIAFATACGTTYMNMSEIVDAITKSPTVDAVEVKHGRWVAYPDEYQICGTEFVCSCCNMSWCNSDMHSDNDFLETMKYCPNCGANMMDG